MTVEHPDVRRGTAIGHIQRGVGAALAAEILGALASATAGKKLRINAAMIRQTWHGAPLRGEGLNSISILNTAHKTTSHARLRQPQIVADGSASSKQWTLGGHSKLLPHAPLAVTMSELMADWRQIQARIRKAKASSAPAEQLAELYERTRDAMVAFELASWYEKAGENSDAVKWYTAAAERFRRAQWRVRPKRH